MKKCELCDSPAKMFCESDQASLCWDCDAQVHGANFLVAKHSRRLLCHVCQSLTPWSGSGPKLLPTVSVCDRCVNSCNQNEGRNEENDGDDDDDLDRDDNTEDDDDDDDGDDNDDDGGDGDEDQGNIDEDDEENQVVPWSSTPPPQASSSSTSEEGLSDSRKAFSWKRTRENAEFHSQNDQGCWSSQLSHKHRKRTVTSRFVNAETCQDQRLL
nr:zinc finger protein CONSTANS-LIKE 4-like [Quercus suber]POE74436.1 b-box domain protein 31 [Quercus suber]